MTSQNTTDMITAEQVAKIADALRADGATEFQVTPNTDGTLTVVGARVPLGALARITGGRTWNAGAPKATPAGSATVYTPVGQAEPVDVDAVLAERERVNRAAYAAAVAALAAVRMGDFAAARAHVNEGRVEDPNYKIDGKVSWEKALDVIKAAEQNAAKAAAKDGQAAPARKVAPAKAAAPAKATPAKTAPAPKTAPAKTAPAKAAAAAKDAPATTGVPAARVAEILAGGEWLRIKVGRTAADLLSIKGVHPYVYRAVKAAVLAATGTAEWHKDDQVKGFVFATAAKAREAIAAWIASVPADANPAPARKAAAPAKATARKAVAGAAAVAKATAKSAPAKAAAIEPTDEIHYTLPTFAETGVSYSKMIKAVRIALNAAGVRNAHCVRVTWADGRDGFALTLADAAHAAKAHTTAMATVKGLVVATAEQSNGYTAFDRA